MGNSRASRLHAPFPPPLTESRRRGDRVRTGCALRPAPASGERGLCRHALVSLEVTKYNVHGRKLGVSSGQPGYLLQGPLLRD